ncbi:hypothetical protein SDC9_57652 [bioreactor metagenome]|uniref:Phasin domain-containing protein n=1 Tax=bioreactor metagenome TaxID=1076179 RepID=A0A644X5I2_9ZZZZ
MTKSQKTETASPFGELSKMIEQYKLPGIDTAALLESRRKDMEALMAANNAALQSMQALAAKQVEIFNETMRSAQENLLALTKPGAMPDPVKQNDVAREAFTKAMAQMSELADIARKAQTETMTIIGKRVLQNRQ